MFDMGFWEIGLIFLILLIVVGPERLPSLARNVGLWVGRMRRMASSFRSEFEREFQVDELRRNIQQSTRSEEIRQLADQVRSINSDLREVSSTAQKALDDPERNLEPATAQAERNAPAPEAADLGAPDPDVDEAKAPLPTESATSVRAKVKAPDPTSKLTAVPPPAHTSSHEPKRIDDD